MSEAKKKIYELLRGDSLLSEEAFKNWRFIAYVMILLLYMISRSHATDQKVLKIARLNREIRELKAEFIDTRTTVMRLELESTVQKKVSEKGLLPAKKPPKKIKVVRVKSE